MTKTALIFGITGQDGSYLSTLLLSKGYAVHGVIRRTSVDNSTRLASIRDDIVLHEGDMADAGSIWRTIQFTQPDEIYNLAAQTHVHTSFAEPEHTADINALGTLRILEAIRTLDVERRIKLYQASTSELFGQGSDEPLNEDSPMLPVSPYGAAKLYAYHMVRMYRQAYGMFACNGILFNHESPVRGDMFVTSKIAGFAASIKKGTWNGDPLHLGNLDAKRDWGHAKDYVQGMWAMLQHPAPHDYVLATGKAHSVRNFVAAALAHAGRSVTWTGHGPDEQGVDDLGRIVVRIDTSLLRPIDVPHLVGDASRAKAELNWTPQTSFEALVADMVEKCST